MELVTKTVLKEKFTAEMKAGGVDIPMVRAVDTKIGVRPEGLRDDVFFKRIADASPMAGPHTFRFTGKYGVSGLDVPQVWADGKTESTRERIRSGRLRMASGSTNTLIPDWQNFFDALRLDLSIRKAANPTVRQFFYNIVNRPDATRIVNLSEIFPYGVIFEEHNGSGQSVRQGVTNGGQADNILIRLYAAGFTWDLIAELFDESFSMSRLSDAVMLGFNSKRDDLAIAPILAYAYGNAGTEKHTAAAVFAGADRQELLYLTIENALDGLGVRLDPVTKRPINTSGAVILASEYDARHITRVAQGLPSTNQRNYPAISALGNVVGFDGETIQYRGETVTYAGATQGTAYLVARNRYMNIVVKRDLVIEVDPQPDVKTLTREERAYWFSEGQQIEGIESYVQKITLPAW